MSSGAPTRGARPRASRAAERALARVRAVSIPVLQAAGAATLAWYLAHDLLDRAQPFFAPIAAAVSLSTSPVQRATRSVQMMIGVLLGIGVAELLHPLLGNGPAAIFVVVLVTLVLAVALGVGFVGQGMMFVNQAAASAILVIALHHLGTGGERATDALIGGGCALLIGVLLFPADPLKVLWSSERQVIECLLGVLRATDHPSLEAELAAGGVLERTLAQLAQARASASVGVRVAPRRMSMRARVKVELERSAYLSLLAEAILGLVRTARELAGSPAAPQAAYGEQIQLLGDSLAELQDAPRPWPERTRERIDERLRGLLSASEPALERPETAVSASAVRRVARDLAKLVDGS